MRDRDDRSHYWDWGAIQIETPRWSPPSFGFTRNGRMIGASVSIGRFWVDLALYRPPWDTG